MLRFAPLNATYHHRVGADALRCGEWTWNATARGTARHVPWAV